MNALKRMWCRLFGHKVRVPSLRLFAIVADTKPHGVYCTRCRKKTMTLQVVVVHGSRLVEQEFHP